MADATEVWGEAPALTLDCTHPTEQRVVVESANIFDLNERCDKHTQSGSYNPSSAQTTYDAFEMALVSGCMAGKLVWIMFALARPGA